MFPKLEPDELVRYSLGDNLLKMSSLLFVFMKGKYRRLWAVFWLYLTPKSLNLTIKIEITFN